MFEKFIDQTCKTRSQFKHKIFKARTLNINSKGKAMKNLVQSLDHLSVPTRDMEAKFEAITKAKEMKLD